MDQPVFVNHYYTHLKDSTISLLTKAKLVCIIEGDEHLSPPSKGVQIEDTPVTTRRSMGEGDEHSTPSSHTVTTGKNRVREAEKVAACGNQATLLQKTGMYVTPRETVIVQPAMGQNNNQPRELHGSMLPDLPDVSQPPPPVQQNDNGYTQKVMNEPDHTPLSRDTEVLESIKGITKVMEDHIRLSNKTAEEGAIQSMTLLQQFIKSQEARALNPALLAIPMFTGRDRSVWTGYHELGMCVSSQAAHFAKNLLINQSYWCKTTSPP